MGRIPIHEEVREGNVSKIESFPTVEAIIRERLAHCPATVGALFFGGISRGSISRRSDIDVLVLYVSEKQDQMDACMRTIENEARRLYVHVEAIMVPTNLASTDMHSVDPGLMLHLQRVARNGKCIKQNPLPYIKTDHFDLMQHTKTYIARKHQLLDHVYRENYLHGYNARESFHYLENVLSAPYHAARKALELTRVPLPHDSREGVFTAWDMVGNPYPLIRILEEESTFDKTLEQMLHVYESLEYSRALRKIAGVCKLSRAFLLEVALYVESYTY